MEICEVVDYHLIKTFTLIYDIALLQRQHRLILVYLFHIYCNTLETYTREN